MRRAKRRHPPSPPGSSLAQVWARGRTASLEDLPPAPPPGRALPSYPLGRRAPQAGRPPLRPEVAAAAAARRSSAIGRASRVKRAPCGGSPSTRAGGCGARPRVRRGAASPARPRCCPTTFSATNPCDRIATSNLISTNCGYMFRLFFLLFVFASCRSSQRPACGKKCRVQEGVMVFVHVFRF